MRQVQRHGSVLGTAAGVDMDGTAFTPVIDTAAYGWKSLCFLANVSGAVEYGMSVGSSRTATTT